MPTSLPQSGSLIARWSADDITPQGDNTNLSSWTSGVGSFAATQATSGNQPKYRTNVIGSKPSVRFTGGSQHMLQIGRPASVVTALDAQTATILIAFRAVGSAQNGALLDTGNDGTGTLIFGGDTTVGLFSDTYMQSVPFAAQSSFSTLSTTIGSYTNAGGTQALQRVFINGGCIGHAGLGMSGPGASGHLAMGGDYTNGAFVNGSFDIFDILIWSSTLTPTEVLQAEMWMREKYGLAYPWASNSTFVLMDGDSITNGNGATHPDGSYPYKAAATLGLSYGQWSNVGIGGDTIANMTSRAAAEVDSVYGLIGKPIRYAAFEWYNQRGAAPTPYNASVAFINARKTANLRVCWGTSTDTDVTTDTDRAAYNSAFDSNHSMCDGYVPIHLNANIGVETANASFPGNWSDGVHLSDAGYTFLASLMATGINTLAFAPAEGSRRRKTNVHPGKRGPVSQISHFRRGFRANTASPNVTVALTGIAATGAVGTVLSTRTVATTGNAATSAPGTLLPTRTIAATGNAATGNVGTAVAALDVGVTGNASAGAVGALGAQSGVPVGSRRRAMGTSPRVTPYNLRKFYKTARSTFVPPSADVTVALTGTAGTGAVGTVLSTRTVAVTGSAATGAVGNVSAGAAGTASLTGVAGAGAVGTATPSTSLALTASAATGAAGNVGISRTVALTGIGATGTAGNVNAGSDVVVAISGVAGSAQIGSVVQSRTIVLPSVSATGSAGRLDVLTAYTANSTQRVGRKSYPGASTRG